MILAPLASAHRYYPLVSQLQQAFDFLRRPDLATLDNGRHEIEGEQMFAIMARELGRIPEASPLEFHRRYLDIQYLIAGDEQIGWRPTAGCAHPTQPYDASRDIGFFSDAPQTWFTLAPGQFAIFFPEDAHAPLASSGKIHKVVVKVAATLMAC